MLGANAFARILFVAHAAPLRCDEISLPCDDLLDVGVQLMTSHTCVVAPDTLIERRYQLFFHAYTPYVRIPWGVAGGSNTTQHKQLAWLAWLAWLAGWLA